MSTPDACHLLYDSGHLKKNVKRNCPKNYSKKTSKEKVKKLMQLKKNLTIPKKSLRKNIIFEKQLPKHIFPKIFKN